MTSIDALEHVVGLTEIGEWQGPSLQEDYHLFVSKKTFGIVSMAYTYEMMNNVIEAPKFKD